METEDQLAAVTESKSKEFQLKWTIEDFSFACPKNKTTENTNKRDMRPFVRANEASHSHSHSSPDFLYQFRSKGINIRGSTIQGWPELINIPTINNVKTRITLRVTRTITRLEANLKFIELQNSMLFKWEFILFNSRCEKLAAYVESSAVEFAQGDETEWRNLISWDDLVKGICHDDKLTLICNVKASPGKYEPKLIDGPLVPNLQSCIVNDFAKLRMNEDLSDMTISVGAKEFRVHKIILAARSPVFASMFKHEMKEATSGKVEIDDMEPTVFEEFLDFIYTGKAKVDEFAWELLPAAEKYDVQDLKAICEDFLADNITKENCLQTLVFGDLHSADKLKKVAMNFIVANSVQIDKTELARWRNQLKDSSLILELTEALMNRK